MDGVLPLATMATMPKDQSKQSKEEGNLPMRGDDDEATGGDGFQWWKARNFSKFLDQKGREGDLDGLMEGDVGGFKDRIQRG